MNKKMHSDSGFTLIELAIVLIIAGFLTVAAVQAYDIYKKQDMVLKTNQSLARVDEAINKYYVVNGRFPCPSDPAKKDGMRGKEWGRPRQQTVSGFPDQSYYDDDEDGILDSKYPDNLKDIWANGAGGSENIKGSGGVISSAYCRKHPDDVGDVYYGKCIKTGQASMCNVSDTEGTDEDYKWVALNIGDINGNHACGANTFPSAVKPSRYACISNGGRPDDGDVDFKPQEIGCFTVDNTCSSTDMDNHNALGWPTGDPNLQIQGALGLRVLIGGVPFYDLGLPETDARDAFGYPLRYAVTLGLTRNKQWDAQKTGIVIAEYDPEKPLTDDLDQKAAQYVLISFGKNANDPGFYSLAGAGQEPVIMGNPPLIRTCKQGTATGGLYTHNGATGGGDGWRENENCDVDQNFISSPGKSLGWTGVGAPPKGYYDDTLVSNINSTATNLWVSANKNVYNTNSGNVGINENTPISKLDVNGDFSTYKIYLEEGRVCHTTGTDTDNDGSNDCGVDGGIDPVVLADGMTCGDNALISSISKGGQYYTCTTVANPPPSLGCPLGWIIVAYNDNTKKIKCAERALPNSCSLYSTDASGKAVTGSEEVTPC